MANQQPAGDIVRPTPNYAESIIKEARRTHHIAGDVKESQAFWAVPDGYRLEEIDQIDVELTRPSRPRGDAQLDTLASLIFYINTFKIETTRIYCKADFIRGSVLFDAVFNDHYVNGAGRLRGYQDWRAKHVPRASPEWEIWTKHNAKPMAQAEFATFLENNMRDIASVQGMPTGAEMLQMAVTLEINSDARFRSAVKLQSGGVSLEFVDTADDATTKRMEVFSRFALGVPPFFGGRAYQVEARLRYRLQGGACSFWYELIRPDLVIADATASAIKELEDATKVPVLMGAIAP